MNQIIFYLFCVPGASIVEYKEVFANYVNDSEGSGIYLQLLEFDINAFLY